MGPKQHHFVLVHGMCHGSWCWAKLIPRLEKAGHRVSTVDMPAGGMDVDDISEFEDYNQPLLHMFNKLPDGEKVVLVGHSFGGVSVTGMSELFPSKIAVAIYVAAMMPPVGSTAMGIMASEPEHNEKWDLKFHFKVEGGLPTSVEIPPQLLKEKFYNTSSDEDLAFAVAHVQRWPFRALMSSPVFTDENYSRVRKVYVLCEQDKATPPVIARKFVKLNPPDELFGLDTDHSPFFSAVDSLEKIFIETAAKYDL